MVNHKLSKDLPVRNVLPTTAKSDTEQRRLPTRQGRTPESIYVI